MSKRLPWISILAACLAASCAQRHFGVPENLGAPVNTPTDENGPFISADRKTLYFHSARGIGSDRIWQASRDGDGGPWSEPRSIGDAVNDLFLSYGLTMSEDELTIYFASNSPALGGEGNYDLWYATRASRGDDWGFPASVGDAVNTPGVESDPRVSRDGLELYFADLDMPPFRSGGVGGGDIWVCRRASPSEPWGEPENLAAVNSAFTDFTPSLADGDLLLFFASNRKGGYGDYDIWVSRRGSLDAPWGPPINVGPRINTPFKESRPYASGDGATLYFGSGRAGGLGGMDIWMADIRGIDGLGR